MVFDSVYYNGNILSMNAGREKYSWLGIKDGKIAGTGLGDEWKENGADAEYDLKGNTVLPGLSDCHVHVLSTGIFLSSVKLDKCTCIQEVLDIIEKKCADEPGDGWVYASCFLPQNMKEKRYPTKYELDKVSHGHKVIVFTATMHGNLYNSAGAEIAAIPDDLAGVEKENGESTGVYTSDESVFLGQRNVFGSFSEEEIWNLIKCCADYAVTKGVTHMHGLFGQFVAGDTDVKLAVERSGELPLDVTIFYQTWNIAEATALGLERIGGCLTLDGAAFEHTMANCEPYVDAPHLRGMLFHSDQEVYDFISEAHRNDLQCTMHAVGERAIDQLLYTYKRVFAEQGRKDLRHRLEHFCLPTEEQIIMAAELGITLSMQPGDSYLWDGAGGELAGILGRERADRMYPFNKIIDSGIVLLSGSDCPVADIDPLKYIAHCINGYNPVRNISVTDAINMCTVNPAYSLHSEKSEGTIEQGKKADFVVINKDPYEYAQSSELFDMHALITVKDGMVVYDKGEL